MAYRELRSLIEMLMALGYPRLISMENFRNPNFPLVAEIMRWLAKRYDENAEIPEDIDTAQDRVFFIKTIAQFMATKAHIRLNTKKLYQADASAVKEMLKAVTALYQALQNSSANILNENAIDQQLISFDVSAKLADLKDVRRLASEITTKGSSLFDLLHKEPELREARMEVLNHPLEISELERHLVNGVKSTQAEIIRVNQMLESVAADESNLEAKIEQRRAELERSQKRLLTLQTVRPAYMDEFERLEEELSGLYHEYVLKFRNMTFLEHQLDQLRLNEEATEQQLKRVSDRLQEERKLRAAGMGDDIDQLLDDEESADVMAGVRGRTQGGNRGRTVVGTMGADDEDESLGGDDDNELGMGSEDDEDGATEEDDEEDDEDELIAAATAFSEMGGKGTMGQRTGPMGGQQRLLGSKGAMPGKAGINDTDDF